MKEIYFIGLLSFLLVGCETTALHHDGKPVQVTWNDTQHMSECEPKGTIVASQGTWYNYWLLNDGDLTEAVLNNLRNKAGKLGANTIHLYAPQTFGTSVTMTANAYLCPKA